MSWVRNVSCRLSAWQQARQTWKEDTERFKAALSA